MGAPALDVGIIVVLRRLDVPVIVVVGTRQAALELVIGRRHVGRILVVGRLLGVVEGLLVGLHRLVVCGLRGLVGGQSCGGVGGNRLVVGRLVLLDRRIVGVQRRSGRIGCTCRPRSSAPGCRSPSGCPRPNSRRRWPGPGSPGRPNCCRAYWGRRSRCSRPGRVEDRLGGGLPARVVGLLVAILHALVGVLRGRVRRLCRLGVGVLRVLGWLRPPGRSSRSSTRPRCHLP